MKKKLNIGIDIDNVLVQTSNCAKDYLYKNLETTEERQLLEENILEIMRGIFPESLKEKLNESFQEICNIAPLMDNAKEIIDQLHEAGHRIIFITARSDDLVPNSISNTLNYFEKNAIYYDEISFDNLNKATACAKFNIDIMIDDSPGVFQDIDQKQTRCLLFVNDINAGSKIEVERIKNWSEILKVVNDITN